MAVYKEPTAFDKYNNPTAFDIKIIEHVTDGDVVLDEKGNEKLLPRPMISGKFDKSPVRTIVSIQLIDEQTHPIELEEIAHAVTIIMNGVQPAAQNSDFEIRHNVSGPSITLRYKEPEDRNGVSRDFAVVTMLTDRFPLDEHFGTRLCAVFDKDGDKAIGNLPQIKQTAPNSVFTPS